MILYFVFPKYHQNTVNLQNISYKVFILVFFLLFMGCTLYNPNQTEPIVCFSKISSEYCRSSKYNLQGFLFLIDF